MAALPKNNAFGPCTPSWNLSFPDGNLTAAEIIAYLPHWLKSIDVIDRLISHGGKAPNMAAMVNEFRDSPRNVMFMPNSVTVMMEYAMRRTGHEGWKITTHFKFPRVIPRPEGDLNVKYFRTPRITHPKIVIDTPRSAAKNEEVAPIEFKNLAIHVKQHPTGSDALDLARCVQYALRNPNEVWLFPTDFQRLVIHLGGPTPITHAHHDRHVFARRNHVRFPVAKPSLQKPRTTKRKRNKAGSGVKLTASDTMSHSGTRKKRSAEDLGHVVSGSKRRSGRLVGKKINFAEDSEFEASDKETFDAPYTTPAKKRKLTRVPRTPDPSAKDGDFVGEESEPDDDDVPAEDEEDMTVVEENIVSPRHTVRGRKATRKASLSPEHSGAIKLKVPSIAPSPHKPTLDPNLPNYMTRPIPASTMAAARLFPPLTPTHLAPPSLSPTRLQIDALTIHLYSSPPYTSLEAMYASAFDYARYGGPRRAPPFRELHRLSDPDGADTSDWAEDIRWAKEQWQVFGSVWTEYGWFLECIGVHRREVGWVSEEVILAEMV